MHVHNSNSYFVRASVENGNSELGREKYAYNNRLCVIFEIVL